MSKELILFFLVSFWTVSVSVLALVRVGWSHGATVRVMPLFAFLHFVGDFKNSLKAWCKEEAASWRKHDARQASIRHEL